MGFEEIVTMLLSMTIIAMVVIVPIVLAIFIFIIIAQAKVNKKAGRPGWSALIPYYCNYIRADIAGNTNYFWTMLIANIASTLLTNIANNVDSSGLMIILSMISLVASIVSLVFFTKIQYGVSRAFGQGVGFTIGLILLPIVFYPMLAWGKYTYVGEDKIGYIDAETFTST